MHTIMTSQKRERATSYTTFISLRKVTPVITHLFGRPFRVLHKQDGSLNTALYTRVWHNQNWIEINTALHRLAARLRIRIPQKKRRHIEKTARHLVNKFQQRRPAINNALQFEGILSSSIFRNDEQALITTRFRLATLLDDGHGLERIEVYDSWILDKPFEISGTNVHFISRDTCSYIDTAQWVLQQVEFMMGVRTQDTQCCVQMAIDAIYDLIDSIEDEVLATEVVQRLNTVLNPETLDSPELSFVTLDEIDPHAECEICHPRPTTPG